MRTLQQLQTAGAKFGWTLELQENGTIKLFLKGSYVHTYSSLKSANAGFVHVW